MKEEKQNQIQEVAKAELGLTQVDQVWHQLTAAHQQQILRSFARVCQTVAERASETMEVQNEQIE